MQSLSYVKYPLWTAWQFVVAPGRAVRNTGIVLAAFYRTVVIGRRALQVLKRHAGGTDGGADRSWSDATRGRYIWRVAHKFWARWILDVGRVRMTIVGYDRVDWRQPCVVVANHQSTIDILALIAILQDGRFVAKREVLRYPVLGAAARFGAQIVIDRADHVQAMAAIRAGMRQWPRCHIVFFPEGTRTRTGQLGPFRRGAFAVARETGLAIVPVAISGTFAALAKGSLLRLGRRPAIRVEFGAPIDGGAATPQDVPQLAAFVRERIAGMLAHPAPAVSPPALDARTSSSAPCA
jgi:1-acyl-sn-glycerol-3-phosphate acyltransferase